METPEEIAAQIEQAEAEINYQMAAEGYKKSYDPAGWTREAAARLKKWADENGVDLAPSTGKESADA